MEGVIALAALAMLVGGGYVGALLFDRRMLQKSDHCCGREGCIRCKRKTEHSKPSPKGP